MGSDTRNLPVREVEPSTTRVGVRDPTVRDVTWRANLNEVFPFPCMFARQELSTLSSVRTLEAR